MTSNYPPGVSGNESHLTGEYHADPHAPFDWQEWEGDDPQAIFWVHYQADEDPMFGPFKTEAEAVKLAESLNNQFTYKNCDIEGTTRLEPDPDMGEGQPTLGQCRICGDLIPVPEKVA
jgi:hypothetical protein